MEFFLDEGMIKTLKPLGIAALGIAAVAGKQSLTQLSLILLTNTVNNRSKNNNKTLKVNHERNQLEYTTKVIHAS